jgi:DNA-3-methyladenine glycosylase II
MQRKKFDESVVYLRQIPKLKSLELHERKPPFKRASDPFQSLVRSIIYQQLSGKAAASILAKLLTNFPDSTYPTPVGMSKLTDSQFKSSGVSSQKAAYLRDLSRRFLDGTIDPSKFSKMTDEEIREHLLVVKGIGTWTVDMFLMFTLFRPDVLPTADLAIRKGFQKLFKLKEMPDAKTMEKLSKKWSPHRTVACWYLWELVDTKP